MTRALRCALAALAASLALGAWAASPSGEHTARAAALLERGNVRGAIAEANRALARDARHAPAYAVRGIARQAAGDAKGALEDFEEAIAIAPGEKAMAVVHANRAAIHRAQGNALAAGADVARAIALDDRLALAYHERARLKSDAGDLDGARADYDRAIQLESKLIPAYAGRAAVNLQAGRIEEALSDYKTLLWLYPRNAEVVASHGLARGLRGETKAAIDDLVRARAMSPASVSDRRAGPDSPARAIEQYVQMNPNDGRAHLMRAVMRLLNGRGAEAEADLARALALDPKLAADVELVRSRR